MQYKRVFRRAQKGRGKGRKKKNNRKAGENMITPQENNKVGENRVENLERKMSQREKQRIDKSVITGMH